ncbi:vWA domain-containing protein [Ruminococcus sp.]|uniref:vWA domain-containing protein n=1 Tax=Ruminococcus sp. TaxID=41978 RepID=UPI002BEF98DD|nr:vWA domain-containing protein [Ruminococcus sp.]HNZ99998.1 VWA domain-containing protein [Ruminococcus sp.]HOH86270.1 VWA domain-containing protein [Ruminococcus sp.]
MKKNLTELVFILDESGSMSGLTADTIGGFNSLIAKQKKEEGEALVSTVFFSNESKVVHDRVKLEEVPQLTDRDYVPSGCTALLDAVGEAVRHISNIHKYAREEDIPEKTLFVITTDGMENASRKYSYNDVKQLISRAQEEKGWEFVFLGANIDAAATAGSMGIRAENAVDYHADGLGTEVLYEAVACAVSSVRTNKGVGRQWKSSVEADNSRRKSKK